MFVGGAWVDARSGATFETVNPFTGRAWAEIPRAGSEDVDDAVSAARAAFDDGPWPQASGNDRARLLRRLADLIAEHAGRIAIVETTDNGKLIREMEGQLRGLADYYHWFAGAADKIHGQTIPADRSNFLIYTVPEPVGVVAAITPWNSPVLLMSWKVAPALAAGCTVVVKPAEQAPASTLEFAALVQEAGFPPGVFNVVTGDGPEAGAPLVAHPGVDKVAFTGGTETGRAVMRSAADHLARVTLELGGKSPNVVFADADLDAAANGVVAGIFAATGQTCMAGSRLMVEDSVHDELLARLAARAEAIRLGDPLDPATEMGPVAFGPPRSRAGGDRGRPRRGRAARQRRQPARRPGARGRLLRRADDLRRGRQRHGDRARGGLRPGARRAALLLRGGGRAARERHPVRAGRGRVDARRPARAPVRARRPRRHGVDQRLPQRRADGAVRRVQGQRHGP
jgi:(Z)-2-((N-methylformamido)methylene)-5-hydroxybutyrolactone dehydrogenase